MSGPIIFSKKPGGPVVFLDAGATVKNVWFVDSNSSTGANSAGYGTGPESPVLTIDYAIGLASAGDRVYVADGHAEEISGATSLVVDKAGVEIIGLGKGSRAPLLTFTAAASTISITGAGCLLENINLYSDFTNGVTSGITIGADADGFKCRNVRMEEASSTKEFLIGISVAAGCHDVEIDGFEFYGATGGTDSQCIIFSGESNFSKITNFKVYGDFSGAPIDALTAASSFITIGHGVIVNDDAAAGLSVSVHASTTGMMSHLDILQAKDTVGPAGAAMAYSQVLVSNAAGAQGILNPVADA